jgi:hypothetical protein
LPRPPAPPEGFREALAEGLDDPAAEVRAGAARCLLALGASRWDEPALSALAAAPGEAERLPASLLRRRDLLGRLLAAAGLQRAWGLWLAARHPREVPVEPLLAALAAVPAAPELLPAALAALARLRHPALGPALLDLYLRLPADARGGLEPLLGRHREAMRAARAAGGRIAPVDAVVLAALLGDPPERVAAALLALPRGERLAALGQLVDAKPVVRLLPWQEWLLDDPAAYAPLAADAAGRLGLRALLPALRRRAAVDPAPALLRAFGELRDRESVALLLDLLDERPSLRPIALESLGRIGGPEARAALAAATRSPRPEDARIAYRALSVCAAEGDDALFRAAVAHPDWYVRLACAEVLGRFARPENVAALARLAADPVPAVSHRALSLLEA